MKKIQLIISFITIVAGGILLIIFQQKNSGVEDHYTSGKAGSFTSTIRPDLTAVQAQLIHIKEVHVDSQEVSIVIDRDNINKSASGILYLNRNFEGDTLKISQEAGLAQERPLFKDVPFENVEQKKKGFVMAYLTQRNKDSSSMGALYIDRIEENTVHFLHYNGICQDGADSCNWGRGITMRVIGQFKR
ncbi:MAG: hypothetical protein AB7S78_02440 [Candidatus Omnitrophota bacterium]